MNVKMLRQAMEMMAMRLRHEEENGSIKAISEPLRVALMNLASDIRLDIVRMKGGKDVRE